MKKDRRTDIEIMKEELEEELRARVALDSKLVQDIDDALEAGDNDKVEKITNLRAHAKVRILELKELLRYAEELKRAKNTNRKIVSDMWANRLNVGGHLLIGGTGLYLGYKTDKTGALTNKSPLRFFSDMFAALSRKNV